MSNHMTSICDGTRGNKMSLLIAVLLLHTIVLCHCADPPKWPQSYTTQGMIELPYAEIKEPFIAFYDGKNGMSRIDYYGGMVYTKQVGYNNKTFGYSYKVAPMTTEKELNVKRCFKVAGSKDAKIEIQSVLPINTTGFQLIGEDITKTKYIWEMTEKIYNKKNTYTLWVDKANGNPVRYEMIGYDTLLGSHYDRYYITYSHFQKNVTSADFNLPPGIKENSCKGFPGPGNMEHRITMNPMREYIHNDDRHIDDMFNKFKHTHNKKYRDHTEHAERKHKFRNNVRFIHSKNRAGLSYSLSVNHLADLTDHEMGMMRGYRHSKHSSALPFNMNNFKVKSIPENVDWRLYGAVTPVKDQAVCGSCWSFGTSGHVEGAYFLKTGELIRLSQQELMDCSWGEGNNACDGGEDFRAYDWIMKHGLAAEEDYGPYLGQDSMCHSANISGRAFISSYVNVTSGDIQALKIAIANQGPISVAIDAASKEFSFYSNGVYYNPKCGKTNDDLDHAVLAVGYGFMNGQSYWLVKNSWSTYWGNDGYVLMSSKDNNCGVATAATYVNIKTN